MVPEALRQSLNNGIKGTLRVKHTLIISSQEQGLELIVSYLLVPGSSHPILYFKIIMTLTTHVDENLLKCTRR